MPFSQLLPDFTALAVQLVPEGRRIVRLLECAQRALIRVATEARRLPGRVGRVASRVSLGYIGAYTVGRLATRPTRPGRRLASVATLIRARCARSKRRTIRRPSGTSWTASVARWAKAERRLRPHLGLAEGIGALTLCRGSGPFMPRPSAPYPSPPALGGGP